jgi:hypothetical protein
MSYQYFLYFSAQVEQADLSHFDDPFRCFVCFRHNYSLFDCICLEAIPLGVIPSGSRAAAAGAEGGGAAAGS